MEDLILTKKRQILLICFARSRNRGGGGQGEFPSNLIIFGFLFVLQKTSHQNILRIFTSAVFYLGAGGSHNGRRGRQADDVEVLHGVWAHHTHSSCHSGHLVSLLRHVPAHHIPREPADKEGVRQVGNLDIMRTSWQEGGQTGRKSRYYENKLTRRGETGRISRY